MGDRTHWPDPEALTVSKPRIKAQIGLYVHDPTEQSGAEQVAVVIPLPSDVHSNEMATRGEPGGPS